MRGIKDMLDVNEGIVVLDGGPGTAMEAAGADLNKNLWTAHYLREDPDLIRRVHREYYAAGADVVITSSYQASVDGFRGEFGDIGSDEEARELIAKSVHIAQMARDDVLREEGGGGDRDDDGGPPRDLRVAASIGPYGACLPGGQEYHGDYGAKMGPDRLREWHRPRFETLADLEKKPDVFAIESIPCLAEVLALLGLLKTRPDARAWMSVTCSDDAALRSGESLAEFVREVERLDVSGQVEAVGVNCTTRSYVPSIVKLLRRHTQRPIVVYPNNGDVYHPETKTWEKRDAVTPEEFAREALAWRDLGKPILIGGCCTTDQRFVKAWSKTLRSK